MQMNNILRVIFVYLGYIVLHYLCVHTYQYTCVPTTFRGFLMSPLMASSPHCRGMRWVIYEMGSKIDLMWITVGVTTVTFVNSVRKN